MPLGDSRSVSLDLSYHKDNAYIWFRCVDMIGF